MASDTPLDTMSYTDKVWLRERRIRMKAIINSVYTNVQGGKVLDVAMGKWSLVKNLFPKLHVVGIDGCPPYHLPDGFVLLDVSKNLPFKSGEFSLVFAGEIVEHLGAEGALHLVTESARMLKSCGYLLLTTPNGFRNHLKRLLRRTLVAAHEYEFSYGETLALIARSGFHVVHSEGIQPVLVPWAVAPRLSSLKLPPSISSQMLFLCQKV